MPNVLVTAFEPYSVWTENASWLALVELTKRLPSDPQVTTRLYPVDLESVAQRLDEDLDTDFDVTLHLGQAPGSVCLQLEMIGLNLVRKNGQPPPTHFCLREDGPVAYQSQLPLAHWATALNAQSVPARVSFHAGTDLCNATHYLSHYLAEQKELRTRSTFIHVPLMPRQVIGANQLYASMSPAETANGLLRILEQIAAGYH